ncbi:hypothetical protein ACOSQ3_031727 [Xanthoceras sorbifolium]
MNVLLEQAVVVKGYHFGHLILCLGQRCYTCRCLFGDVEMKRLSTGCFPEAVKLALQRTSCGILFHFANAHSPSFTFTVQVSVACMCMIMCEHCHGMDT